MVESADPQAEERVGLVLNEKWTLERLLGKGGMAAVYAARHRNGARAAVKVLHPELSRIPEVRERFLREGYAANRVEHRGVVQVLDDDVVKEGPQEGTAYIVMELLEGESMEDRAHRDPPMTQRELLDVADAVLEVLEAAHAHGVVHRDLKPENLFLARDPDHGGVRVKVLDFGLARLAEVESATSSGLALGTPSFMSPEQAGGKRDEIDGRTDIFALGATMFRVFSGQRIHDADHIVALVVKMATQPAPRLRTVAPDASEAFARVVDRALAFSREDRYQDAASMRADVVAARELLDVGEAPTLNVVPYSARLAVSGTEGRADESPRSAASRTPAPVEAPRRSSFLGKIIALVAVGGAAWMLFPGLRSHVNVLADAGGLLPTLSSAGETIFIVDAAVVEPTTAIEASAPEPIVDIDDVDGGEPEDDDGGVDDDLDGGIEEDASIPDAAPVIVPVHRRPPHVVKPPARKKHPRRRPR